MGYTHYYYVSKEFNKDNFAKVSVDFKKMIPVLKHMGIQLAGPMGTGYPTISPTTITFNGDEKCGHTERDLGITWPSGTAKGVSKNGTETILSDIVKGSWFAGASLETRVCGGDCSHETFTLEQKMKPQKFEQNNDEGLVFECTKTAYKPYDLAVNVCLIIAQHYLGDQIRISSDGEMENWEEGMQLCQHFLGYGKDFKFREGD